MPNPRPSPLQGLLRTSSSCLLSALGRGRRAELALQSPKPVSEFVLGNTGTGDLAQTGVLVLPVSRRWVPSVGGNPTLCGGLPSLNSGLRGSLSGCPSLRVSAGVQRHWSSPAAPSSPPKSAPQGQDSEESDSLQVGGSSSNSGSTESSSVASTEDGKGGGSGGAARGRGFVSRLHLQEVVVVGYARTAVGAFQGSLAHLPAPLLGGAAIAGALLRAGIPGEAVQEVVMGNVLSAGAGQAPGRQAARAAGTPDSTVCTTINKVCASGLKAVMLGAQSVVLGCHEVVAAGGMESMSLAPFLLPRTTSLRRAGDIPLLDSLALDGLRDALSSEPMGALVEECVEELRISKDDQDEEAVSSYSKALDAEATGIFCHEIVSPLPPVLPEGFKCPQSYEPLMFDEELKKFDPDRLRQLKPSFSPDGTVTAGNASSLSDGAAALILTSERYAQEHGLPILARVLGWADAEQAPNRFPTSPALAIPRALQAAGLQLKDAGLFEIQEAFAAVTLANSGLLGLQKEQVNIHGGAVALGHPIGASGARILVSLLTALAVTGEDIGVAAVCNGGGGASALVVQREPSFTISEHGKPKAL